MLAGQSPGNSAGDSVEADARSSLNSATFSSVTRVPVRPRVVLLEQDRR